MRKNAIAAVTAGICLICAQPGAAWARPPAIRARGLESMPYAAARTVILQHGWTPLSGDCEVAGADTCGKYPEIGACSGIDPGFCGMVFVQRSRCLYVGTTGGLPGARGADARVQSVNFRRGPCGKN